jgi:small ligand-binding sensory domain FIST
MTHRQGDFLIRNVAGADPESGSIWIGHQLRQNQVVQFHLRDARTSAEDLAHILAELNDELEQREPAGALLFSCTGRGEGLYGLADHDSGSFRSNIGASPLGGFFCNGEIGQVGGTAFIHGYTSAFAVFRARAKT